MKPAAFAYYDPTTVDEVVALLAQFADEAKLLAGGQSLMPVLNMRLARPAHVIDLNKVQGLSGIRLQEGWLVVGAMTRHSEVECSELVARYSPLLAEAVRHVGHIQIRNRGTLGGSLVHADPAAELPGVARALDAVFVVMGPAGRREIAATDFFVMYYTTALAPGELLVEVRFPVAAPREGHCFVELARRSGDFALCGVAATLQLAADDTIIAARVALVGVGMRPVRAAAAEALLVGQRASAALFDQVGEVCQGEVEPDSDVHATGDYRRQLARALTARALATCHARAQGGGQP